MRIHRIPHTHPPYRFFYSQSQTLNLSTLNLPPCLPCYVPLQSLSLSLFPTVPPSSSSLCIFSFASFLLCVCPLSIRPMCLPSVFPFYPLSFLLLYVSSLQPSHHDLSLPVSPPMSLPLVCPLCLSAFCLSPLSTPLPLPLAPMIQRRVFTP
jgi:hypothetical protein